MGEFHEPAALLASGEVIPEVMSLMGKYEIGRLLGRGAFAKVYHARNVSTGQSVAVKAVCKQKVVKGGFMGNIKREISIMRQLRHPNIVRIHEVLATKSKVYFVMEFAKGGELFTKVEKGRFSEDLSRKYFRQLVSAVGFCHSHGVFHRDLKLENLLLDENLDLKVTDFGLSAVRDQIRPDGLLHTLCGTPAYVAPEILAKKGYDGAKVDVWSCGIILFVLTAGYLPFNDQNLIAMYKKIYRGEFRCPKWMSPELKRLLSLLLDTNPDTRITIDEILRDPWFIKGNVEINYDYEFELHNYDSKEYKYGEDGNCPPKCLNAFDIISFSSGFDLSGLFTDSFEVPGCGEPERFVSAEEPDRILDRVEGVAREENLSVVKRNEWGARLEGQDGKFIAGIKINRLTEGLVLVELEVERKQRGGECSRGIWKDKLRPCLRDLVYQPDDPVSGN